jgi:hypothetical protein
MAFLLNSVKNLTVQNFVESGLTGGAFALPVKPVSSDGHHSKSKDTTEFAELFS